MKRRDRKPLKPLVPKAGGPSPSKIDPTGTTSIRRAMMTLIKGKFARLKGKIVTLIAKEDALGLITPSNVSVSNSFCATGEGGGVDPSCSPGRQLVEGALKEKPLTVAQLVKAVGLDREAVVGHLGKLVREGKLEDGVNKRGQPTYQLKKGKEPDPTTRTPTPTRESKQVEHEPPKDKQTKESKQVIPLTHESVLQHVDEIAQRETSYGGMIPIHVLRQAIAGKHGQDAASHESLDTMLRHMRRSDQLRLIAIGDYSRATAQQLKESIPGDNETFFYVEKRHSTTNTFCPTGEGGGIDSSCSPNKDGKSGSGNGNNNGNESSTSKSPGTTLLHNALEGWMKDGNLSPQQASSYRDAFHTVVSGMSESSRIIFHSNLDKVIFHPSTQEVTNAFRRTGGYPRGKVGGFWDFDPSSETGKQGKGTLHVNGGSDTGEDYTGPIQLISHIYSHESGHVLDRGHLLSNSKEWREAYGSEIKSPDDPLSKAATKSPAEGFAEYARLLFLHPDKAKDKQFSKCYSAWKKHGLLEDTKMTANVLYSVDPWNTFNVLIYNGVSGDGRWVTLKGGQHVYLSDGGELLVGKEQIDRYLESKSTGEQDDTERGRGEGTVSIARTDDAASPQVATETERPSLAGTDKNGSRGTEPPGTEPNQSVSQEGVKKENTPPVSEEARQQAVGLEQVNQKLDRYHELFTKKGLYEQALWMSQLRDHINEVGTQQALEGLGDPIQGLSVKQGGEQVQYGGHADVSQFTEQYLDRHGISLIQGGQFDPNRRVISTVAPSSDKDEQGNYIGVPRREGAFGESVRGKEDIYPTLQGLRDKLHESQNLPGLEKSEDIGKLMGKEFGSRVDNFTPEVVAKLDEQYGKGQWVVKAYGDEAYAGYGVFFPQRVDQLKREAQDNIWSAGQHLAKEGYQLARHPDTGKIIGVVHESGDAYQFGTPEYDQNVKGNTRVFADYISTDRRVSDNKGGYVSVGSPIDSEHGTSMPAGKFMAQPAFAVVGISNEERAKGITFKTGQEGRVHISTKDGVATIVPHSTWLKEEKLPVVFESEDTKAMAKAAVDAINHLPIHEKQGQIYAPDIVKTKDGYRVVEANPANEAGASGYLQDNPMIMDSYVSHVIGREPAHVSFIRKLLSEHKSQREGGEHAGDQEHTERVTSTQGDSGSRTAGSTVRGPEGQGRDISTEVHKEEAYRQIAPAIQRKRAAEETLMHAQQNVRKYGFDLLYGETGKDKYKAIGIEHDNGDKYIFGSKKYKDTIQGDVREWSDKASVASKDAQQALPAIGKQLANENRGSIESKAQSPESAIGKLKSNGVGELAPSSEDGRSHHPDYIQREHNQEILDAAKKSGLYTPPERLPFLANDTKNVGGFEHDVYHDPSTHTYYKLTSNGKFGHNSKDIHEYLQRHEVANELWPSLGYKFHGVTEDHAGRPQAIMSMHEVKGEHPPQHEINNWFREKGWEPVGWDGPQSEENIRAWRDPSTGTKISDTHTGNFIKNAKGLVPIDVDILPGKKH